KEGKDGEKKKSPVMLIVLLVVGLAAGLGVAKFTGGSSAPAVDPPPEPGEVANIEPININLANGHFLRIGIGAQLTKKVTTKAKEWSTTEGAKVSDAIIKVFSGKDITAVQSTQGREE